VSWLVPEKGIDVLLRAMKQVFASGSDVHLIVVGEGPKRSEYEALACQLGIADRVIFTGSISQPTQAGVFDAADICCQMSQWEEAFGLVIAEAMAAGRPVVASRVGGVPELVANGETGFLVDRRDEKEAASRILELVQDRTLRTRMGAAGRERARKFFDLKTNVARLLDEWGV
jgi:L-malate glycosyltransferase